MNRILFECAQYAAAQLQKRAFVPMGPSSGQPPGGAPPGGPPPGAMPPGGGDPTAAGQVPPLPPPPAPPPGAGGDPGAAAPPPDPSQAAPPPPDAGQPPPPDAGQAPPPDAGQAPPSSQPDIGTMVRDAVRQELQTMGVGGHKTKSKASEEPPPWAQQIRKLLTHLYGAQGIPLPHDILDEPKADGGQAHAGGEKKAAEQVTATLGNAALPASQRAAAVSSLLGALHNVARSA